MGKGKRKENAEYAREEDIKEQFEITVTFRACQSAQNHGERL